MKITDNILPKAFEPYRNEHIWVCFGDGKKPLNVRTLGGTCEKWNGAGTYDEAVSRIGDASPKFGTVMGVGFFFQKVGLIGVDLDHCVNDGIVEPDAEEIVKLLDSYTEISVSGTGLHIICKADSNVTGLLGERVSLQNGKREIYNNNRFFTITGNVYHGYSDINERTSVIPEFIQKYIEPYRTTKAKKERKTEIKKNSASAADDGLTPEARAIKSHDWEFFRKKLKCKPQRFDNADSFFRFLYCGVNLAEFLGVPEGENFSCFFHRPDVHPSANVYRDPKRGGKWFYHCATCEMDWGIKFVVEALGNFGSEVDSIEFLKNALNISITETTWTRKQLQTLDGIEDKLLKTNDESFDTICKTANAKLKVNGKLLFLAIISHAKKSLYPRKYFKDESVVFKMSLSMLQSVSGREKTSRDRINQWVAAFIRLGMISRLNDDSIPKPLLYAEQRKAGKNRKHCNFYRLYPWVINRLLFIQWNAEEFDRLGYKVSKMRYQTVMRAEGQEVADRLFTQPTRESKEKGLKIKTMNETANNRAEYRENRLHDVLGNVLRDHGYVTVDLLRTEYKNMYGYSISEQRVNELLPGYVNMYGLIRTRANAIIKQRYGIKGSPRSCPIVYVLPEG